MLIVITGLDGSGTSTIANELSKLDEGSIVLKTPSPEYADRDKIDTLVRKDSITAHFLYYLSSTVYMSDYIKNNLDYKNKNVYCVRYLIDTIVSNRVAGLNIDLDYNIYGNELLKPDLTLFVNVDEDLRQTRITARGKSELDKVLDDDKKRKLFREEFQKLLPNETLIIDNNNENIEATVETAYNFIKEYEISKKANKDKVYQKRKMKK